MKIWYNENQHPEEAEADAQGDAAAPQQPQETDQPQAAAADKESQQEQPDASPEVTAEPGPDTGAPSAGKPPLAPGSKQQAAAAAAAAGAAAARAGKKMGAASRPQSEAGSMPGDQPSSSDAADLTIVFEAKPADGAKAAPSPFDDAASIGGASAAPSAVGGVRRSYYIDWLRAFLTLVVVLHHCVTAYLGSSPWAKKKGNDNALWLLFQLFVVGNQAYFMTVFFFLSGLYVPASYRRKRALKFLADRTLRLVLPCLVYSFLVPPFTMYWNDLAAGKPDADLAASFRTWLKPGWPTTYVLPTGPPWFVWMLWCFNVAYVILKLIASAPPLARLAERLEARRGAGLPTLASVIGEYTPRQTLAGAAAITGGLTLLQYATRMLDAFAFDVKPASFISRGPFVAFMPDFFVVYVVAFALGIYATPKALNHLPRGWAGWCLSAAGVWWLLAGWLPNITLHSMLAMQQGGGPFAAAWLLRTFVEQSFCVVWSLGLIVLFRDALNARPGALGKRLCGAAYGAYLVHPIMILLFARAAMGLNAPSFVVNAVAISLPVAVCSWAVAVGLRAIPGADPFQ